jgi:hypothetical protein
MLTIPAAIVIAAALAATPPTLTYAELEESPDTTRVLVYDGDGRVAAEVAISQDLDGRPRIDAFFPDGVYLVAVTDGDNVLIDSDNPSEAASRLVAIHDLLAEQDGREGKLSCALGVVATTAACAGQFYLGCGLGLYTTYCDCRHTANPEFECP